MWTSVNFCELSYTQCGPWSMCDSWSPFRHGVIWWGRSPQSHFKGIKILWQHL